MTAGEFIKILDDCYVSHYFVQFINNQEEKFTGKFLTKYDKIVIDCKGDLNLGYLEEIPPDIIFRNGGRVNLEGIKEMPSGIIFENNGYVNLRDLKKISPDTKFYSKGWIAFDSMDIFDFPNNLRFDIPDNRDIRCKGIWFGNLASGLEEIRLKDQLNIMNKRLGI